MVPPGLFSSELISDAVDPVLVGTIPDPLVPVPECDIQAHLSP